MLGKFYERYLKNGDEQRTPLVLVNSNISFIPLKDNCIDVALVSAVFLHNHKSVIKKSVDEIFRVLKPGGKLITFGCFPNKYTLTGLQGLLPILFLKLTKQSERNGPLRYYTKKEVLSVFKSFKEIKMRYSDFSLFPKTLLIFPYFINVFYRRIFFNMINNFLEKLLSKKTKNALCTYFDVTATK